eukprot:scaffold26288_cov111-Isochrysis_galbana.AAC.5
MSGVGRRARGVNRAPVGACSADASSCKCRCRCVQVQPRQHRGCVSVTAAPAASPNLVGCAPVWKESSSRRYVEPAAVAVGRTQSQGRSNGASRDSESEHVDVRGASAAGRRTARCVHPVPMQHGGQVDGRQRWLSRPRQCQQQPKRELRLT